MKITREYALPLIGFIVTLVLALISDFALGLARESTFLIFAIGSTVTIAMTVLKSELTEAIDSRISRVLELYSLYGRITDPELQQLAADLMDKTRTELSYLSRDIVNQPADLEFQERLANAKSRIITCAVESESLSWKMESLPSREVNWYRSLLDAINRGCLVEEIHIIDETEFDISTLTFKELGPIQDGRVQKYIVTREEATRRGGTQLLYNFTIIDNDEVLYQRVVPGGGYDTVVDKSTAGIRQFIRRYQTLEKIGTRVLPD